MKDKKMIKKILKNFDFEKVHTVMETLDWTWVQTENKVPNVDVLKKEAKRLLKEALNGEITVSTGGFEASYVDGFLELKFIVSEYNVDKLEDK